MPLPTTSDPASSLVAPLEATSSAAPEQVKIKLAARLRAAVSHAAPVLTFLGLIALWEICCKVFAVQSFVLPAPSDFCE